MSERAIRMGLCALHSMGRPDIPELLTQFSAEELWEALLTSDTDSVWVRKARTINLEALETQTQAAGARFIIPSDPEWPAGLARLDGCQVSGLGGSPPGLWVLGDPEALGSLSVAVVGSRTPSTYGVTVAMEIASDLALAGRTVVSGLAFGIDAAAHRGALAVRGRTVAVMACGIDGVYPKAHKDLHDQIQRDGAIVTEVAPGTSPMRASFLARNRIIAAISAGVVVVEAAARSGARNTASWGNAVGASVMAVPGLVTSSLSATPHWLVQQGEAELVTCAADIERLLGPLQPELELDFRGADRPLDQLRSELSALREVIGASEAVSAGELADRTGFTVPQVLAGVTELEELGFLDQISPQQWVLRG